MVFRMDNACFYDYDRDIFLINHFCFDDQVVVNTWHLNKNRSHDHSVIGIHDN